MEAKRVENYIRHHYLPIQTELKCVTWNVCRSQIWMCTKSLKCTGICSRKSKYVLNNSNLYVDRQRKEFSIFRNGMICPVKNFSNGVEDTVETSTFSSNNSP